MITKLTDMPVGSTVKMNIGGAPKEFIIVNQGVPSDMYDASCDGTWLVIKDIYSKIKWDENSSIVYYYQSSIHSYLNSEFLNLFDGDIKQAIKQVKIPFQNSRGVSAGADGLNCKIFLLSGSEVGFTDADRAELISEGTKLSYFESDSSRISHLEGAPSPWWLRSKIIVSNIEDMIFYVNPNGRLTYRPYRFEDGVRPALIFPSNHGVNDNGEVVLINSPPTIPGVPQYKYPIPGEEMPVKWQASTDSENGTVTYIVETKLGDGEWTQARETPETSCLVSVPQVSAAETMIIVRVKAKDQEGAESAYSTGEAAEILYHKVIRKIPWQQGKPFKARQYTYNGKKQYQTMREGALAGIEAEP